MSRPRYPSDQAPRPTSPAGNRLTQVGRTYAGFLPKAERELEPQPAVPPLRRFSWEA